MATVSDEDSTVRTTVTIPKVDYDEMERIAKEKRVSVAWVVREAVAEYLSEELQIEKDSSRKGAKR